MSHEMIGGIRVVSDERIPPGTMALVQPGGYELVARNGWPALMEVEPPRVLAVVRLTPTEPTNG